MLLMVVMVTMVLMMVMVTMVTTAKDLGESVIGTMDLREGEVDAKKGFERVVEGEDQACGLLSWWWCCCHSGGGGGVVMAGGLLS